MKEIGLIDTCPENARCDRCDLPLQGSTFNDIKIVYAVPKHRTFWCVRCAVRKNKVTTEQIEQQVNQLVRVR